jgi:hypothetical protein
LTDLLAAFMEQRNILWGEVVGGLLIVGCSVALVISIWQTLRENPLYQLGTFAGVTAALFGAGLYTLGHWRLEATSRGLLVIATLLVPLNLLVLSTARAEGAGGIPVMLAEVGSLTVFGTFLALAGKVLVPRWRWRYAAGVLGISASMLLVPHILRGADVNTPANILLAGGVPVCLYLCSIGRAIAGRRGAVDPRLARSQIGLLGMSTFALGVALGFVALWSADQGGSLAEALQRLSVLVAMAGVPLLIGGARLHRGLASAPEASGWRAAGTGVALAGATSMVTAAGLAWPQPAVVIPVCGLDVAVFTLAAFRYGLPLAHAVALPCLAIGYLAAWLLAAGLLGDPAVLSPLLLFSADSARALAGLFVMLAVASEGMARAGQRSHAAAYAAGCAGVAAVSLMGITAPASGFGGIEDPRAAAALYALYGTGGLLLNLRWRWPLACGAGVALLVSATLWVLEWLAPTQFATWAAVLGAEVLTLASLGALLRFPRGTGSADSHGIVANPFGPPLLRSAEAGSIAAAVAAVWSSIAATPWAAGTTLTAGLLTLAYAVLAMADASAARARICGVLLGATGVLAGGWVGIHQPQTDLLACVDLGLAAAAAIAATWASIAASYQVGGRFSAFTQAGREVSAVLGALAFILPLTAGPPTSLVYIASGLLLAPTAFALGWGFRNSAFSAIGSLLGLATGVYALSRTTGLDFPTPLLDFALLGHATIAFGVAFAVERLLRPADAARAVLAAPLGLTGLVTSALALPLLVATRSPWIVPAGGLLWLALLWLAVAWLRVRADFFSASQIALALAVVYSTAAWLEGQTWFAESPLGHAARLIDPRSLQAFGIGLGLLSLVWVAARIALRRRAAAQALLEPGWPAVDRVTLAGLVVGHWLLASLVLFPDVAAEFLVGSGLEPLSLWPPALRAHAWGMGTWDMLAILCAALAVSLWDRADTAALGLVVQALTAAVLAAGAVAAPATAAPALSWALAVCFLAMSVPVWCRAPLRQWATACGIRVIRPSAVLLGVWALLFVGVIVPVVLLGVADVVRLIGRMAVVVGEITVAGMARLQAGAGPLALLALALAGHGVRERSAALAFGAGLVGNLAASLAVLHLVPHGEPGRFVLLAQANLIAAALTALLFLRFRRRLYEPTGFLTPSRRLLGVQAVVPFLGNVGLLALGATQLVTPPGATLAPEFTPVGGVWGWLALILGAAAALWHAALTGVPRSVDVLGGLGLGVGVLAASGIGQGTGDGWAALHGLTIAWTLAGLAMLGLKRAAAAGADDPQFRPWVYVFGSLTIILALAAAEAGDPGGTYWPVVGVLGANTLFGLLALLSRRPTDVYASGMLLNLAGLLMRPPGDDDFVLVQVLCLAGASALWSCVEFALRWSGPAGSVRGHWPAFSHVTAVGALSLLGLWLFVRLADGSPPERELPRLWLALASTSFAVVVCLWDTTALFPPRALYAAGMMGVGIGLLGADSGRNGGLTSLAVSAYVLGITGVASAARRADTLMTVIRIPRRPWPKRWFSRTQSCAGGFALLWSVVVAVGIPHGRMQAMGPLSAALLVPAGALMAGRYPTRRDGPTRMHFATLAVAVLAGAEGGWVLLAHAGHEGGWLRLHDATVLLAALALGALVYGAAFPRWLRPLTAWAETGRRTGPVLGALAAILVGVILAQEVFVFDGHRTLGVLLARMLRQTPPEAWAAAPGAEPMAPWAVALVAAGLLALVGAGVCFAALPGRDPLGLSVRGRTLYVYAAEVLLILLFVHLRLTAPWLFRLDLFAKYWPFILMALAFAGAGLSEVFHRRGMPVMAEPLERTGLFIPLLPVLAFWVLPDSRYAALWFSAGLFYGLLSVRRQSFGLAVLAGVSANVGLWVLWHYQDIPLVRHPQLWLIPPALAALAAEHHNRDQLSPALGAGLRYSALSVIYVSSTADMFIAGLGRSVVLPLVLTLLSVLGILIGMLLHVRAFLFLGLAFLLVVILSMIWHAGVDRHHTWILWSCGIALGAVILTLFGFFEKRRHEVLQFVEELRRWE